MRFGWASVVVIAGALAVSGCSREAAGGADVEANARAAAFFMESNADEDGVITLPSGLQYKVITAAPAGAASPDRNDLVRVDYEGALTDGSVFDSSFSRGQPYVTTAEQVVPGWTEALQLMKVGDEWTLYVPPELGYGERGQGADIPPNSVLVFRIRLLDVAPVPGGGRGTGVATG
jgi:peptidylprolyl isomerase/FKBP-type peptidyl-prolyl cis-trans isomerase FklB